jgi:molecular chaperone HtpG
VMDTLIDVNYMSFIEYSGVEATFVRVDSDVSGLTETSEEGKDLDADALQTLFRNALDQKDLTVKLEALADRDLPAMVTQEEQMRRFKDMSVAYGREFSMPDQYTLILNRLSPVIQSLAQMEEGDISRLLCQQIYDLARLSSRPLEADDLKAFIARSNKVLAEMVGQE